MRAAKLVAPKKIEIQEVAAVESIKDTEVLIDVKYCGICGTDMHIFEGHRPDVPLPRIMGHEFSGVVSKVGAKVDHVAVGDAVVVDPVVACGTCATCESGHPNVCATVMCLGVQTDGCMVDQFIADGKQVYKLPAGIDLRTAATIEPYSIAANVVGASNPQKDDICLIYGAGTIGLCVAQAMSLFCNNIIVTDVIDEKLEAAKSFGATETINSKKEDVTSRVMELTDNRGVNIVVDAVGLAAILEQSIGLCAPCATIVNLGFDAGEAKIKPIDLTKKEIKIHGSRMNCYQFPKLLTWFESGALNPQKLISKEFDFVDCQKAFETAVDKSQNYIKIMLKY